MTKVSPAQQRALDIIRRDYADEPFCKPYDLEAKRDVSGATLRKLYQLGYIEHVRTDEVKYYVRDPRSFGSGNYNQRVRYENIWRLKQDGK